MGGAGGVELREVEADRLEEPGRRAVAAGHAAPDVLMEIDEDIHAVIVGHVAERGEIVEIGRVVFPRTFMLDRFPGRQQSQAVEAPGLQAAEMLMRLGERKGTADEGDGPVIGKIARNVGVAVRREGHLAVAAEIDAAQDMRPAVLALEPLALDLQPRQRHQVLPHPCSTAFWSGEDSGWRGRHNR